MTAVEPYYQIELSFIFIYGPGRFTGKGGTNNMVHLFNVKAITGKPGPIILYGNLGQAVYSFHLWLCDAFYGANNAGHFVGIGCQCIEVFTKYFNGYILA